jgi:hypothetical protein
VKLRIAATNFISHFGVSFLASAQTGMARALIYGTYTFCVFGIGCCFCNIFAAAEVSYSNQGARELYLVGGTELGAKFSLAARACHSRQFFVSFSQLPCSHSDSFVFLHCHCSNFSQS